MALKKTFSCLIALLITLSAIAQDKIYKRNGEIIDGRVSAVNSDYITFKRANNLDGPEYTVAKNEVSKIRYTNGTEDIFEENSTQLGVAYTRDAVSDVRMTRNIFAIAPIAITENGFGMSISYEHFLDRTGYVSLYLPLTTTFNSVETTNGTYDRLDPMVYFAPGIKIYTDGNSAKRTRFSVGPSLVVAAGRGTRDDYYYYQTYHRYAEQTRFLAGALVNAGFNVFPTHSLYLGGDAGLGIAYINQYNGRNKGISALAQFSFRVGYRF